uniref:Uncharacterized protein n=1 Tax=Acrobeloides nanus TaxID=290746 RepID=A0A914CJL4_9BILA
MAEAYRRAENELQKIRTGFGFFGIAFIGGAGAYTLIKRRFAHKIIVPGTYAEEIRPVIDKIYEEQQISALTSTFPTANEPKQSKSWYIW